MSPSGCIQTSQGTKVCVGRTLENVTFDLQCYSLPRFSGGNVGNQVEFGLESINAVCGLCVYMYVSPKTSKTKLLLIHLHPHSFHLKKNPFTRTLDASLLLCFASHLLRVAISFQPLVHRAPRDRTQVLQHLLSHRGQAQLSVSNPVLWMSRGEEQPQVSVLWVGRVFAVKTRIIAI